MLVGIFRLRFRFQAPQANLSVRKHANEDEMGISIQSMGLILGKTLKNLNETYSKIVLSFNWTVNDKK